jgi:hypothetical protein
VYSFHLRAVIADVDADADADADAEADAEADADADAEAVDGGMTGCGCDPSSPGVINISQRRSNKGEGNLTKVDCDQN